MIRDVLNISIKERVYDLPEGRSNSHPAGFPAWFICLHVISLSCSPEYISA
jgi:hypothetical protein